MMLSETSFITNISNNNGNEPIQLLVLKNEAIDRLDSVVDDLPKYKNKFEELIVNFTVDKMLCLMNTIDRDNEFKTSIYHKIYTQYFDEIEELIHNYYK
jgi:ASC-1-like (ASCH) protein